eukprot:6188281-Pleurochrysis_carterae.AAC.3
MKTDFGVLQKHSERVSSVRFLPDAQTNPQRAIHGAGCSSCWDGIGTLEICLASITCYRWHFYAFLRMPKSVTRYIERPLQFNPLPACARLQAISVSVCSRPDSIVVDRVITGGAGGARA